jgi:hypothetical protein
MIEEKHVHEFKTPKLVKVPLYRYELSNGKMRNAADSGHDLIRQLVCDCGKIETLDLQRVAL